MLWVYPKRAQTACGIKIVAHYPNDGMALPETGDKLRVTECPADLDCPECYTAVRDE
jgi:hypothetical protein